MTNSESSKDSTLLPPKKIAEVLTKSPSSSGSTSIASDLSVDETVLLAESGFEPAGMVIGACTYHVGITGFYAPNQNLEIGALSSAFHAARSRATSQLIAEGKGLGAVGVVGVNIELKPVHGKLVEFVATGTAIRPAGKGDSARKITATTATVLSKVNPGNFFTSDLSGREFLLLARAGYLPLGLVFGACVYHVGRQGFSSWINNQNANVELPTYTGALYNARELAMGRMQSDAELLRADGVVGVSINESSHIWGSHVIEFLAYGTAVRLVADTHHMADPSLAVPLDDPVTTTNPGSMLGE